MVITYQYRGENILQSDSDRENIREWSYRMFVLLFIFTIPYGYFGINLINSNTNPLSMYLLPIFLLLIAPRISKIWDIELVLGVLISILCLSTLHSLFNPFNGSQAIIRIAGYCVGFSYFVITLRNFCSDLNVEHWIAVAYLPVLLFGLFETFVVITGVFTEFISSFRLLFVSTPSIVPSRVSLFASEPSFIAFQIPLLLYIFHRQHKYIHLSMLFPIIVFSNSINVYLTTSVFYISLVAYELVSKHLSLRRIGIGISTASISFIYITRTPQMYNRIISITQDTSILERFYYIISKIPMVKEFPLGVGVGQYGTYVHSIFTQYNIPIVAPWVLTNLRSGTLDPWSFVLGMVAEGGIIIIPAILLFLSRMFHVSKVNRFSFAAFVSSTFLLFQTYPPATPYVWILFGLIWHRNMV